MNKTRLGTIILVVGFLFFIQGVYAKEHLIVNSEDWKDVYSAMHYANLKGYDSDFLTSTAYGPILLGDIPKTKDITIISSKNRPFVFGYKQTAEDMGFASVNEKMVGSANLELIEELKGIKNFIVVEDSYGYNAIAVTPYAILTNSWVFLADRANIAEIEMILNRRDVKNVMIYGYVDREISDALKKYNPKIINTGDRFNDNIEIVKEYKKLKETKQISLSNGEFIERELMAGDHPILFTGRTNVPDQIANYLKNSDFKVGVLVGNDLINAATNIRRNTGLSIMVKFAQGARTRTAGVSAVEGLDLFPVPTPTLNLEVYSVKYNKASSQIEVSYHSLANVPMYIKGTLTVVVNGETKKVGDLDPVFIAPKDYKTLIYPIKILADTDLEAEVYVLFGEAPTSLDRQLKKTYKMGLINLIDKCKIKVNYIKYNKQAKSFYIGVKNLADVGCYVDIELEGVEINEVKKTIGAEGSELIGAGKKGRIEIPKRMDSVDLKNNQFISLVAYYGEREETLVNVYKGKFKLDIDRFTGMTYLIVGVIALLVLLILFLFRLKREKEW